MHGPPGSGKTSVKQLFLGREPLSPENQNSTGQNSNSINTVELQGVKKTLRPHYVHCRLWEAQYPFWKLKLHKK